MTALATRIERSPRSIGAVLDSDERAQFEAEFRTAAACVAERLDLSPLDAVLDRWWGIAAIRVNPLTEHERSLVARARAGDDTGWLDADEGVAEL